MSSILIDPALAGSTPTVALPRPGAPTPAVSRRMVRAGRIASALPVAFLLFDAGIKLAVVEPVVEGMAQLGYPAGLARPIGLLLLACVAVYVVPRTSFLGALLLTGYLGGAVATHVRVGNPFFTHTLFPVYVAVLLWGGLVLRDPLLRAVVWPSRGRRG